MFQVEWQRTNDDEGYNVAFLYTREEANEFAELVQGAIVSEMKDGSWGEQVVKMYNLFVKYNRMYNTLSKAVFSMCEDMKRLVEGVE
jgi:hypothetical protein